MQHPFVVMRPAPRSASRGLRAACWTWLLVTAFTASAGGSPPAEAAPDADSSAPGLFEATSHRSFADVPRWAAVFDDPGRDAWQKPEKTVKALGLWPGARVADLGAGTGYFIAHLAAAVGASGSVMAVDVEPSLVAHLRDRAAADSIENVVPILASPNNPRLPPGAADMVMIVDTFHHLDSRLRYFRNLQRSLAPEGRIAIIDWRKRELPVGPPPPHKLSREQVIREMRAAGYRLEEAPDFLPYQYFLIFRVEVPAN
jgi:ubiquinone/menaquinone biosynthesis C-methylase UbiE